MTPAAAASQGGAEEQEVFPPTLREVMLRPRWIGMLVLCLVVASVFAWLLQWQLARAIDTTPTEAGATEVVRPLDEVVTPGSYLDESLGGQRVETTGHWIPGDFIVVSSRHNAGDGDGYWVTGQLRLADRDTPTSLAVAIGWAPTREDAEQAARAFDEAADGAEVAVRGRIISDEGPALPPPGADAREQVRMSPAALLSLWHETVVDGERIDVYRPYLASDDPTAGLAVDDLRAISSPAPELAGPVNWLNLFYAAEWAIFAVFSFYLWYRLAKDAWEREVEDLVGADPDDETA